MGQRASVFISRGGKVSSDEYTTLQWSSFIDRSVGRYLAEYPEENLFALVENIVRDNTHCSSIDFDGGSGLNITGALSRDSEPVFIKSAFVPEPMIYHLDSSSIGMSLDADSPEQVTFFWGNDFDDNVITFTLSVEALREQGSNGIRNLVKVF